MKCTCPEDWQGMDHTSGCKARSAAPAPSAEVAGLVKKLRDVKARPARTVWGDVPNPYYPVNLSKAERATIIAALNSASAKPKPHC